MEYIVQETGGVRVGDIYIDASMLLTPTDSSIEKIQMEHISVY